MGLGLGSGVRDRYGPGSHVKLREQPAIRVRVRDKVRVRVRVDHDVRVTVRIYRAVTESSVRARAHKPYRGEWIGVLDMVRVGVMPSPTPY